MFIRDHLCPRYSENLQDQAKNGAHSILFASTDIQSFSYTHSACLSHCLGVLPVFSQPIPLASIASPGPAVPTLEDVPGKVVITLFALIGPTNHLPALVCAIVTVSEVLHRLLHLYHMFDGRHCILRLVTRHYLFRSSHKTGFIPLGAATCLPSLSANVAEFGAARTAGTCVSQY